MELENIVANTVYLKAREGTFQIKNLKAYDSGIIHEHVCGWQFYIQNSWCYSFCYYGHLAGRSLAIKFNTPTVQEYGCLCIIFILSVESIRQF